MELLNIEQGEHPVDNTSLPNDAVTEVRIHHVRLALFMSSEIASALFTYGVVQSEGRILTFRLPAEDYQQIILPLMEADAEKSLTMRAPRLVRFLRECAEAGMERETIPADCVQLFRISDLGFLGLIHLVLNSFLTTTQSKRSYTWSQQRSASTLTLRNNLNIA